MNPIANTIVAALVGAAVASLATVVLRPPASAESPSEPVSPGPDAAPGEALARIEALDRRIEALESAPALPPPQRRDAAAPTGLLEQLDRIEERLAALEARPPDGRTFPPMTPDRLARSGPIDQEPIETDEERDARLARERLAHELTILDPTATDEEKHEAHAALRRVADAYTPAMVDALVDLAASAQDPELRARTWTMFDGTTRVPALVPHLTFAARNDAAFQVRREAAETLGNYMDDPTVVALLEDLAANDAHKEVRERARRTLGE